MKFALPTLALLLFSPGVLAARKPCGGLKGLKCPAGFKCVDNPKDSCDPAQGGADCIGYCVKTHPDVVKTLQVKARGAHPREAAAPRITAVPQATTTCNKKKSTCIEKWNNCGTNYGGCYNECHPTTYTAPPGCTKSTCKPATRCEDFFDNCGNTYGPGCINTCKGATFTKPYCKKG